MIRCRAVTPSSLVRSLNLSCTVRKIFTVDRQRPEPGSSSCPHESASHANVLTPRPEAHSGCDTKTALISSDLTLVLSSVPGGGGQAHLHTLGNCTEISGRQPRNMCARKSRYRCLPNPTAVPCRISHIRFSFPMPFSCPLLVSIKKSG